jgi:thioredoxin 1
MAGNALELTDANFATTALKATQPVLVDFWAVWCGPCRMVGPVIEELAGDYQGRAVIGKVDVDSNREVATTYRIQSIPTLLFLKGGQEVDRIVGAADKRAIKAKLDALL